LFGFSLTGDIRDIYPTLYKIVGDSDSSLNIPKNIIKKKRYVNQLPLGCKACQLREECDSPVLSSAGIYNISIVGEAPGNDENEEGKGYIGDAGKLLWKELDKYSLRRNMFHIANICRCWPSISKTPNKKQIDACFPFLIKELQMIECRLILATGNIPLRAFTGEAGGITGKNGTTEWNEKIGAWICWCVHPSSVLHNPLENKKYFEDGIKNFAETVKRLI
ncbi:MAG: uracil-DNA glycosylase, partial [Novosphingobium sp.]|nr:uracil-DNA glycosylase [Novosphingobium sp.]